MMSVRAFARSAPRTLTRLGSSTIRVTRVAQPSSLLRTAWVPLRTPQLAATFSSTPLRQAPESEADQELLAKLESEVQYEDEMKSQEPISATVSDFIENSPFEIKDEAGKQDVYLVRKFNNETITISFSISDITNYDSDLYNEDNALTDEEMESPEGKQLAETEAEEGMEDEPEPAIPCRLNIVVEKPDHGALNIEAVAQDGAIIVENFYYYKEPSMAHSSSPEAVHTAEDAYPGPLFGSLDEDLQLLMERYLEERGISQSLAIFVPEYMDMKEQREYHSWLKNIKNFIKA
ncbi:mitochondrial glycoprotein [Xylaria nigripes]|nr:mitochondrial glycoprotein [Xylaria nigripes]